MTFKRIIAYFIDMIFVMLLVSMLNQIRFLNPNFEQYYDANNRYMEIYTNAVEEGNLNFMNSDEYKNVTYDLQRSSVSNSIIEIVVYIGYFVVFQIFNKGQTLGKKVIKIKVVDNKDKELKWPQLLLRTVILCGIYSQVLVLILLFILNKSTYGTVYNILTMITNVVFYVSVLMMILRKDNRSLHDIIAGTKVIQE